MTLARTRALCAALSRCFATRPRRLTTLKPKSAAAFCCQSSSGTHRSAHTRGGCGCLLCRVLVNAVWSSSQYCGSAQRERTCVDPRRRRSIAASTFLRRVVTNISGVAFILRVCAHIVYWIPNAILAINQITPCGRRNRPYAKHRPNSPQFSTSSCRRVVSQ